jgi:DNA repair protein RAD5
MEIKTDSVLFNKLLDILDTYNTIYEEAVPSYINLHTSATVDANKNAKNMINNVGNQPTVQKKARRRYYDGNSDNSDDSDDENVKQDQTGGTINVANNNPSNSKNLLNNEKNQLINNISNSILDHDYVSGYNSIMTIKTKITNFLIAQILDNSPEADVVKTKFPNIKTELYPYQINNLNWMLNIENKLYSEEYDELTRKLEFKGGGLFDEVGMGKTLQIITLINTNVSKYNSMVKGTQLYSKATLVIVPNHLCGQWAREFDIHLSKSIKIINLLTKVHYKKYSYFDFMNADVVIVSANFFTNCKLNQHEEFDPMSNILDIFNKDVNIFSIYWHRVVIDEFHEIEDSNLFLKLKFLESNYRWIISGTPFKEKQVISYTELDKTSLSAVIDYLTFGVNHINKIDLFNKVSYSYIKNHFSRNTHNKNIRILKLPEIKEEIIWLNFTETERMIYNAYLADPNNTVNDVFLRQLCCHPLISDKIRENISNKVESLEDIQKHIKKMYMSDFDLADEHYKKCLERIDRIKTEMKEMEKEAKTNLMGYSNLKDDLYVAQGKVADLKKIRDGKEKTVIYYKTFIDLISDMQNVTKQNCSICLDPIKEHDLGITFCGHIYCYSCISTIVKESKSSGSFSSCPDCKKPLQLDKIFLISENKSKEVNTLGTKLAYIIKYIKSTPKKYRIIFSQWDYLLKEVGKVLEQNGIKQLYCQGNVYQKDKVLRLFNNKDSDNNEFRIIMLSSESTVSGSNLNNAEEVIFLDPIYGDKQYRTNTENQAIGRVRRLGNKHKEIKVLRLFIKDSVEEDIYKSNIVN